MKKFRTAARIGMVAIGLALVVTLAVSGCAALGEGATGERLARMKQSPEWKHDQFENAQPMWNNMWNAVTRSFESTPGEVPDAPLPVVFSQGEALQTAPASGLRVTWFGHSSTLVEIDGSKVLIDPIWSERPSPVPSIGPTRFFQPPIPLAQLPAIDVVVISHDHYDHLDHRTIVAMRDWRNVFVVPLGIGAHLQRWGIPADRIIELDWWQSTRVGELLVTSTPSRHASGRLMPQSDVTLWSGYALTGNQHRVFYSGDTGLLPSMQEVGDRLGPFDLALVEVGQYDADWPDWHLGPEQAVMVHRMVKARVLMPVHWGLFKLAHHSWTEPIERVLVAAQCTGATVISPRPGESIEPSTQLAGQPERWWPDIPWRNAASTPIIATVAGDPSHRVAPLRCGTDADGEPGQPALKPPAPARPNAGLLTEAATGTAPASAPAPS